MRWFVVGLSLLALHAEAAAQTQMARKRVVAVEGWSEALSVESSALLRRAVRALKARGFRSAPQPGVTLKEAEQLLESGHALFSNDQQEQAAKVLSKLVTKLREPPADPREAEELLTKQMPALVLLSQASFRLGDRKGGAERLEMVERQFPDKAIPYDDLGPESVERRPKIAKRLAKRRKASLVVHAAPHGVIVLDGRKVGFGEAKLRLHSGTYAVFARMGDARSPVEWVAIKPGATKSVSLSLPQGKQLANTFGSSETVLLSVWNNRLLKGVLYRDGEKVRKRRIKVGDDDSLDEFIDALSEAEEAVIHAPTPTPIVARREEDSKERLVDKFLVGSLGLLLAGTAVMAVALVDTDRETEWLVGGGSTIALGGVVLLGTIIYAEW